MQDLFGVSMIIPLLPKLINNLGASRALAGLIGECRYMYMQVLRSLVNISIACSVLSLVPRPFEGEEKGPGTFCTRMRQLPQENLGYCKRLYAFSPSSRGLGYEATLI